MRTLILANGDSPSARQMQRLAKRHDLLIAADGAAHRAAVLGITPDIICGDFDSGDPAVAAKEFPQAEMVPTPDQDYTDLEKAILLARERGATSITIAGAMGGRMDHTLGNIALLVRYHRELPLRIVDDSTTIVAVSGTDELPGESILTTKPGDTVSLVSFDGLARVSLSGVRWPLRDERVPVGSHAVSNVATARRVRVCVRGGVVLVCHLVS